MDPQPTDRADVTSDSPGARAQNALVESGPVHRGQNFSGLRTTWSEKLNTSLHRSAKGVLPPEADIVMPLFHGMGPATSHAGSMLATLNVLTASKKKSGRSESLKALRSLPHYRLVGGEAIDLPGAFGRAIPSELDSLSGLCNWVADWLKSLREACHVPLVPIARSASAMILLRVNEIYPDLLRGLVLLSPMVPFDSAHSNADLLDRVVNSQCSLNQTAYDYMNRLTKEADWDRQPDPFHGLSTLILTGGRDTQVSDRVREKCGDWANALPHVEFINLWDAGHDVFNLRDRIPGRAAFGELYRFLATICPLQSEDAESSRCIATEE